MSVDATTAAVPLTGLYPEELAETLGLKPFQGRQVFRWIHRKGVMNFGEMTDLSKELRTRLSSERPIAGLVPLTTSESPVTHTRKALLRLPDGETVEAVHIPAQQRTTFCISSQIGCPVKCSFCATGLSGYARNLSAGEIVEQAIYLRSTLDQDAPTPNIVYMGMGEPFFNYDEVVRSVRLLMHPEGMAIGARRITVSTAGDVRGIERFAEEDWQVRLSISLHSANDSTRDVLVPLNRRYPIERLMEAVDFYMERSGRQVTFEWALLADTNDSPADARELSDLIGRRKIHVNLIPYNPVAGAGYQPPSRKTAERFQELLRRRGVQATLRLERGQDINAACGQLRRQAS